MSSLNPEQAQTTRGKGSLYLLAAGAAAIVLAVVYAFDPSKNGLYPPCVFNKLTGLQCPGCGGTRALHALLHGDVSAAFALNPMLFVGMVTAVVIAARPSILAKPWFAWAAAAALLGWGVLRNLFL